MAKLAALMARKSISYCIVGFPFCAQALIGLEDGSAKLPSPKQTLL
jgi:hypothetical protein